MNLKELLGGLKGIFDPEIAHPGNFCIPLGLFWSVGIDNGNNNLAMDWYINKYFKKIEEAFGDARIKGLYDYIYLTSYMENNRRKIKLDPSILFLKVLEKEYNITMPLKIVENKEELDKLFLGTLKNYRTRARDILNGNTKIEDDKEIYAIYEKTKKLDAAKSKKQDIDQVTKLTITANTICASINYGTNFNDFIQKTYTSYEKSFLEHFIKVTTDYMKAYRNSYEIFDQIEFDFDGLEENINFEELCFSYAMSNFDLCQKSIKTDDEDYSYGAIFLDRYEKAIKEIRKVDKNYNFKIDSKNKHKSNKIPFYSISEFLHKYANLKEKLTNENLKYYAMIDTSLDVDYRDYRNVEIAIDKLKKKEEIEVLVANWNLIPKGEVEQCDKVSKKTNTNSQSSDFSRNYEESPKLEVTLENTDYEYWLEGKDKFQGYRGFLYKNGYILFERVKLDKDDNYKAYRVKDNATYLMNLTNFTKMSKLAKTEIIEFIKSGNTDVKRIYHTASWQSKVKSISQKESCFDISLYPDGIYSIIKELIAAGQMIKETQEEYKLNLELSEN